MNDIIDMVRSDYVKKVKIVFVFLLVITMISCEKSNNNDFPDLSGDYLGQILPDSNAILFAPEIISLENRLESKIVFSPDGNTVYIQIYNNDFMSTIYYSSLVDNKWSEPIEAPFSIDNNIQLASVSVDGSKLFFSTNVRNQNKLYSVNINAEGWGEQEILPVPYNSEAGDSSYIETADGNGFLTSSRDGSAGKDIWMIFKTDDNELQAEILNDNINSSSLDFSPCVASDGSFMIFGSDRFGRNGLARLYISFYDEENGWSEARNVNSSGSQINDDYANQANPTLSPDGKYLFFMRHYGTYEMDLYWVSTSFVEEIKASVLP